MDILKNKLQVLVTLLLLGFVVWWASFQHIVNSQPPTSQWFGNIYGVVAFIGAVIGYYAAMKWGGFKTTLGRALLLFSLGLFLQETGQLAYSYYSTIDHIQIPYPSWGDVGYFGSVLSYMCAALLLASTAGVKTALKKPINKTVAIVVLLVLVTVSCSILLHNHHFHTNRPITVFLDAGYPIIDALYVSIAIIAYLLSKKLLGGTMKAGILLVIFALFIQYIADFTFVYQASRNTYVVGAYDDLFYLIAYFTMTVAMIKFYTIYSQLRVKNNE